MAFTASSLALFGASGNSNSIWLYKSNDTLAVILAASYFNDYVKYMNVGDLLHVYADADGTPQFVDLVVTANNGTTVTVGQKEDLGTALPAAHTANATLTAALNAGRLNLFNDADGATLTLPAASGSGDVYRFAIGVAISGGNAIVKVANSTDIIQGNAIVAQDAGDTVVMFEAGATADTITLNGTTTGGKVGDCFEIVDAAAGLFLIRNCILAATGTEATPFSATV